MGQPAADWDADIRNYWESGILPPTLSPDATASPEMTATVVPDATAMPEGTEEQDLMELQGVMLATDFLDSSIQLQDPDNPDAGIDDAIVDVETGEIQYIVINTTFDDGERWIPVTLNHLQWDANDEIFVLNADRAALLDAPFFEDGQYPDASADGWDSNFDTFWQNFDFVPGTEVEATPTP
jgi:hypothetical protein